MSEMENIEEKYEICLKCDGRKEGYNFCNTSLCPLWKKDETIYEFGFPD